MAAGQRWGVLMADGRRWGARLAAGRRWGARMADGRRWGARMADRRRWGARMAAGPKLVVPWRHPKTRRWWCLRRQDTSSTNRSNSGRGRGRGRRSRGRGRRSRGSGRHCRRSDCRCRRRGRRHRRPRGTRPQGGGAREHFYQRARERKTRRLGMKYRFLEVGIDIYGEGNEIFWEKS